MTKKPVNGINLYYETFGQGEPVVFIAGFSADHTAWREMIALFQAQYQIILFDNRGAGQTEVPAGPYSIETMAEDVVLLCKELNLPKAHFVGNSMGGFITQMLAWRYPELVKSLVLSNTATTTQSPFRMHLAAQLELIRANAPAKALLKANYAWLFSYPFLSQAGMLEKMTQLNLINPYPFSLQHY